VSQGWAGTARRDGNHPQAAAGERITTLPSRAHHCSRRSQRCRRRAGLADLLAGPRWGRAHPHRRARWPPSRAGLLLAGQRSSTTRPGPRPPLPHRPPHHLRTVARTPDVAAEWVDTRWWTATATDGMAGSRHSRRRNDARPLGRRLRRPDAAWSISTRTAQQSGHGQQGLATAVTRQRQGDPSPSSWHLGPLLSSDDVGSSVERTAKLHP
jgi:hypothetical protein